MKTQGWLVKQGVLLTAIAVLTSILTFGKEAVFASFFGVSYVADAYTIAIQVPEILFAIVWEAIGAVVIPLYTEKINTCGKDGARKFFSALLIIVCLLSGTVILFGEFLAEQIVYIFSPGISKSTHSLAVELMRWIFPMLFFEGIVRVCTGVLNVHNQFIIPRILTSVRNIGVIVFLVLFANRFGVYAAAVGILTGIVVECIFCVLTTLRYEKFNLRLDIKDPFLLKAGKMALPLILGIGVREINHMADKIVASFLGAGSISSLNYASKLSSIIEVVLLSNIVTVLYPTYSVYAAEGKKKELTDIYQKTINICILMCVPIIFGGIFLSREIVSVAFERGSFDKNSVIVVASIFSIYIASTLFTTVNGASVKLFTSCYDTKTPTVNSVVGVIINIVLNIVFSYFFGVTGLAWATLIAAVFICVRLIFLARNKIYKFSVQSIFAVFIKSFLSGVVMFVVLYLFKTFIWANIGGDTLLHTVIYCVISVSVGALIYAVMLLLTDVEEVKEFIGIVKKKVKKN